jgi:uncharacterized SAM-binding protein YcdF (DUF218 family)
LDYLVSKVLTLVAMPLGLGGLAALVGVLCLALSRRVLGSALVLVGLVWIWLWATPVFSDWVRWSLEGPYPPIPVESQPRADAIVILGGAMQGALPPRLHPDLGSAADRIWHGARLYHAGKAPLIIASGGRLEWNLSEGPEADGMGRLLVDLGVPRERILLEGKSRTTYENARELKPLLAEHGIGPVILVTSALHMRRAVATFQTAGIRVLPAPADHEVVSQARRTPLDFVPDAEALEGSSRALKEYLGLLVYWLRGQAADTRSDQSQGSPALPSPVDTTGGR